MTRVTFDWDTEVEYREYAFWKHGETSADAVINIAHATYELAPGSYEMFWRAYGAASTPIKLSIHAGERELLVIDSGTTAAGTGGGVADFVVP